MSEDISLLAENNSCTPDDMQVSLKQHYDGYRFSRISPEVYNPYSLMKAFQNKEIANYWFESGTPSYLIQQMKHFRTDITTLDDMEVPVDSFDVPTEAMTTALPLLYQSGYLTIKSYDPVMKTYRLSIPNQEVRIGFVKGLLPSAIGLEAGSVQVGFAG